MQDATGEIVMGGTIGRVGPCLDAFGNVVERNVPIGDAERMRDISLEEFLRGMQEQMERDEREENEGDEGEWTHGSWDDGI